MNPLLKNLTKFIGTVIQLYPLPYELVTDLHTLNAYLKSYSQSQEMLLEGFVNRQVDKLQQKMKSSQGIQNITTANIQLCDTMPNFNFQLTKKLSDMKIHIPTQMSEFSISQNKSCLEKNQSAFLSQRSGRSSKNGIKSDRHKFGNRQRNKTQKTLTTLSNKENVHSNANLRVEDLCDKNQIPEQKSLKFIKSQAELLHGPNHNSQGFHRMSSTDGRKEEASKPKQRYESFEHRLIPYPSSLKIKLKPKPSLDLAKLTEGIHSLSTEMSAISQEIDLLLQQMCLDSGDLEVELE